VRFSFRNVNGIWIRLSKVNVGCCVNDIDFIEDYIWIHHIIDIWVGIEFVVTEAEPRNPKKRCMCIRYPDE
jgi:hypothetical protein